MKIQCATCINESTVIEQLERMYPDQLSFNSFYCLYQDSVRIHKCTDYISAFFPTHFAELDSMG
jgi:hypothetical protein